MVWSILIKRLAETHINERELRNSAANTLVVQALLVRAYLRATPKTKEPERIA